MIVECLDAHPLGVGRRLTFMMTEWDKARL